MPFPVINDHTAEENLQEIYQYIESLSPPDNVKKALQDLFEQVSITSVRLFDDVQELKTWRATLDKSYTPTKPF